MKRLVSKIWVPLMIVMLAAAQSFGIDAGRAVSLRRLTDSLILSRIEDSSAVSLPVPDSTVAAVSDSILISARDTIVIPDSLEIKDPFFFKYYIAVKDSVTRRQVRDSLMQAHDSLELHKFDSLYIKDSTEVAKAKFDAWYTSLSRKERKKYDAKQNLPILMAEARRKMEIKDSIRARKDSIIEATPRILETFAVPTEMQYKRIITWKHDQNFHNLVELREQDADTCFNNNFYDFPFMKNDVNATWLGVAGSPVQTYNFFKREINQDAKYFTPYEIWSYTPETLPMYNTKTPYTELGYTGTLFSNQEKEEANVKVLTTQNITPELNLTLLYTRFGGNGMLKREDVDYRTFVVATNYLGKKYLMHAGYIYNRIEKSENGGIIDMSMIRDTTVDAREIDVYLRDAGSKMRTNTVFLNQSYRIPFHFIEDIKNRKELKREEAVRDSIMASGDSVAIAAYKAAEEAKMAMNTDDDETQQDTVSTSQNITTAFIGHSSEFAVFRRSYTDKIASSDKAGREFFHDRFYINPTQSKDSMRVMRVENKAFIRLQPWKSDGIVSKLDVGLGDKVLNFYSFQPTDYLSGPSNVTQNSLYLYAGANGQYDKYFKWDASGKYNFLGYEINDNLPYKSFVQDVLGMVEDANKRFKNKKEGLTFNTELIPAENVGVKHAKWDREAGYVVPRDCYNSYFYKVEDDSLNVIDKFKLHGKPYIEHLTGGSALHLNLEEHLSKEQYRHLLHVAAKEGCNYFTFNIPNTVCNECGHIDKRYLHKCPKCGSDKIDYLTRIIGYLKRVSNFSEARQKEAAQRHYIGQVKDL